MSDAVSSRPAAGCRPSVSWIPPVASSIDVVSASPVHCACSVRDSRREHAREHAAARAHLLEHRVTRTTDRQPDQLAGTHRQRPQQDGVDEREHGGHAAETARQRKERGAGQTGPPGELPQREPHDCQR